MNSGLSYFARKLFSLWLAVTALFLTAFPASAIIDAALQMQLGNPSNATADTNNHTHYLIQRPVQALDYNDSLGQPNWASWDLTASDIGSSDRSTVFFVDTNLPANFYKVGTGEYSGSGFHRGHMCPSADRTDNTTNNDMVFYMSNIIPQTPENNQGVWATFEGYCRTLAQSGYEVLIMCGPSGFDGSHISSSVHVAIPSNTWKIVTVVPAGGGTALSRITTTNRVISLLIPNTSTVSSAWQDYITSAHQIELQTGFTFFTALPGTVASAFRNKIDGLTNPPAPVLSSFSPTIGMVNNNVMITGTNFNSASTVKFNGTSAVFTVDSTTQITTIVPAGAESGTLSVTTPGGTATSAGSFSVDSNTAPDLVIAATHSGSFTQGSTGDTCTILVNNFGNAASSGTVTVSNVLPVGLVATAISGTGWTVNLGALTATRSDTLAVGSAYPALNVTVNVAPNAPASATNTAIIAGGSDAYLANNTASDLITINPSTIVETLVGWNVSGQTNFGVSPLPPTTNAANLTIGGLTRGSGVGTSGTGAARAWGGTGFTNTTAVAATGSNQFITFTVAANSGYKVSYSSLNPFDYRRSATGPANGVLQYQITSGPFNDIIVLSYPSNTSAGGSIGAIDLSGVAALQNVGAGTNVTFRIVNWNGTSASGTWYVFDVANSSAPDLAVQGSITPDVLLTPVETWRWQWFGTTNDTDEAADTYVGTADGMPNLLKYALGLNPLVPAVNPAVSDISTGHLRLTIPKYPAASDVSFLVEVTSDLKTLWSGDGITIELDTPTLLQAHDNTPIDLSTTRFIRVRVTRQ